MDEKHRSIEKNGKEANPERTVLFRESEIDTAIVRDALVAKVALQDAPRERKRDYTNAIGAIRRREERASVTAETMRSALWLTC